MKTLYPRSILVALLTVFVLSTILSQSVFAGFNGQQIEFRTSVTGNDGVKIQKIGSIKGTNQKGQTTTYSTNLFSATDSYKVSGYFWKGQVQVRIFVVHPKSGNTNKLDCNVFVPTRQVGDYTRITFNLNSCW